MIAPAKSERKFASVKFDHHKRLRRAKISARAKDVGSAIIAFCDEQKGGACTKSLGWLAVDLDRSPDTVRRGLVELEKAGLFTIERSAGRAAHRIFMRFDEGSEGTEEVPSDTSNPCTMLQGLNDDPTLADLSDLRGSTLATCCNPNSVSNQSAPGRPSRAGPVASAAAADRLVEDPENDPANPATTEPVETQAGWRPASVTDAGRPEEVAIASEVAKIDAMEERSRPTSEPFPLASAPSTDDREDDEDQDQGEDDLPALVIRAYRLEWNGAYPSSRAELHEFSEEAGLEVTDADLRELAEELGEDPDDDIPIPTTIDRPTDDDDLARLRAGADLDRHGRPIFVSDYEVDASVMLADPVRRARFVGRTCDALFSRQPSERAKFWSGTCSRLHHSIRSAGLAKETYDDLAKPFSDEIRAEMTRRDAAFRQHFREANA